MSKIDYQALREAAEKATKGKWAVEFDDEIYSTDGINHEQIAMVFSENESRDAEFIAAANPATVLALLDEINALEETRINDVCRIAELTKQLELAKSKLNEQREYYEGVISDGSKRIAELEKSEEQLINERDHAESALADMYFAATGDRPEWSNWFGFSDAVDTVVDRIADLEAKQPSPVVLEGLVKAVRFYEQVKCENPPAETGAWKDAVDWVLKEACQAVNIGTKGDAGEQSDEKP
ncbi:TPA: ead/Ea22-like family protein [Escherichia coli]|nr:ead/Ea22-like family protein [Escherichia coli]